MSLAAVEAEAAALLLAIYGPGWQHITLQLLHRHYTDYSAADVQAAALSRQTPLWRTQRAHHQMQRAHHQMPVLQIYHHTHTRVCYNTQRNTAQLTAVVHTVLVAAVQCDVWLTLGCASPLPAAHTAQSPRELNCTSLLQVNLHTARWHVVCAFARQQDAALSPRRTSGDLPVSSASQKNVFGCPTHRCV